MAHETDVGERTMMHDFGIYQVGYKLGAIQELIRSSTAATRFQRLERATATVAVVAAGRNSDASGDEVKQSDEYFLARILLGILQRGQSPLVSPWIEEWLLADLPHPFCISPIDSIGQELTLPDAERAQFIEALCASHFTVDPRVTADWTSVLDSRSERTFFEDSLRKLLSLGISLVEAQRPIQSMLDEDGIDFNSFAEQRVDFAVETPTGAKIVFELDGLHHFSQETQRNDQRRDAALKRAGWFIERVPIKELSSAMPFSAEVRKRVGADWLLSELSRTSRPNPTSNRMVREASRLLLSSHAIARVQLAVLLALMNGTLRFDSKRWTIGVIERDVACAQMAIEDLLDQFRHLGSIYGVSLEPKVVLYVCDASELKLRRPLMGSHPAVKA